MRIEIKKVSIMSMLFSALPIAVFAVMLIWGLINIFGGNQTSTSVFGLIMSAVAMAVVRTLILMVCAVVGGFVYNLLCAIGLKGFRMDLEDK
ncbi:ABC-type polysaccharide/polyol phosphate export permease [Elusimicrobium simillimum]|uniref:hypothetical protein n=1 Tax=Elusimicrobium simillimum TaxID=3143438 RepID=UPI003C6F966B